MLLQLTFPGSGRAGHGLAGAARKFADRTTLAHPIDPSVVACPGG